MQVGFCGATRRNILRYIFRGRLAGSCWARQTAHWNSLTLCREFERFKAVTNAARHLAQTGQKKIKVSHDITSIRFQLWRVNKQKQALSLSFSLVLSLVGCSWRGDAEAFGGSKQRSSKPDQNWCKVWSDLTFRSRDLTPNTHGSF